MCGRQRTCGALFLQTESDDRSGNCRGLAWIGAVEAGPLRRATSCDPTGTPLATFTRITASNGFNSPEFETESRKSNSSKEFCWQTYSTAACVPIVVAPARIRTECAGFNPRFSAMME